jgi:hypothetical protein
MMHGRRDFAIWSIATAIILFCFGAVIVHGISWLMARGGPDVTSLYSNPGGTYSPQVAGGTGFGIIILLPPTFAILWLLAKWMRFGRRIWWTTRRE